MGISSTEYIKYLTERVVGYMETPKEEKMRIKEEAKAQREQWLIRWFGAGGAYIYYARKNKHRDHQDE